MAMGRKFTLLYDPAEDRMIWDMEDDAGEATRIWITQRMCRQFVGALIPRLPQPGPQVAAEHRAAVQGFEQAAAMSNFGSAPPVQPTRVTTAGRARAINIAPTAGRIGLTFDLGEAVQRAVSLDPTAARQMLTLLYALHVQASWPVDFWPAWVAAAAQPAAAGAPTPAVN
jgi:hypothetical protein